MDFERLEKNICDVIKEEQIKLGYQSEKISLYYPLQSLNRFLKTEFTISEMLSALMDFNEYVKDRLGELEISNKKDRFCLTLPPQATDYVYESYHSNPFLEEFIHTVEKHNISIETVLQLFHKYSEHVHVEPHPQEDFDYLVYFEDGYPDDFRYCLTDEGVHIIYHRFTIEDYEDMFGAS